MKSKDQQLLEEAYNSIVSKDPFLQTKTKEGMSFEDFMSAAREFLKGDDKFEEAANMSQGADKVDSETILDILRDPFYNINLSIEGNKVFAASGTSVNESDEGSKELTGHTVEIEVPLEWMQYAYTAHERPNSPDVLAKLMGDIMDYKGKGRSNKSRYEYAMKLTKNNTQPAVDGIKTTSPELKPIDRRPGDPTSGW